MRANSSSPGSDYPHCTYCWEYAVIEYLLAVIRQTGGETGLQNVKRDSDPLRVFSGVSAEVFLKLFGEHFFVFCKHAGYDAMLRTLGGNLVEFIGNLDALHSYLALSYQVCSLVCRYSRS